MHLEHYEIGETVARTVRTLVRRARRIADGMPVVVKTSVREYPSVRELRQLEFEYYILTKLGGKGIIRAIELERQSGRLAMILEDFGGERLSVRPGNGLALDLFFRVATDVTRTLAQVHASNVIHKDINPANILMNPSTREVRLIDFSLSSELSREHLELEPSTQLEGTLPYMSPEQTGRMNRDLDYRTDYYSLGATFFELLTGVQPFSAPDAIGYVHCHISKPVPNPRDLDASIPEGLARLVGKLMAKDPDHRYQSARGLLEDLIECQRRWEAAGAVASFPLGTRDGSERFQVSQKLVGREAEVATLMSVFESASRGPAKLLLVAGYSGIGKSSLVREIHESVGQKQATFIAGKFDQLERNSPYGAVAQALRGLVKQLLAEPEELLLEWKKRLADALGANGNVLIGLVPELEQVLGPQTAVPDLPAREAQRRLQRVFRDFVKAVATAAHPLVIFLDDLQWTDASTPQLLERLLADEELRYVLVIGAYRDNEVLEGHLLKVALAELKENRPDAAHEIRLLPLTEDDLNHMVADSLHCEPEESRALSALLFQKTAGNPFFVNELLGVLHREGALRFDAERGRFVWDDNKVTRAAVTDNVADLMVQRVKSLPAETVECLRLASCLGNEFDLVMLARVAARSPVAVGAALWEAVQQRLLFPQGDGYRLLRGDSDVTKLAGLTIRYQFPHDRVLQAVYSLLDENERATIHLRIGRMLLEEADEGDRERRVFDFVDHLNLGRKLVTPLSERDELSRLNYAAGQRARRSAAYAAAVAYLDTSLTVLSSDEWKARPDRYFECCRMRVECIFLSGQVERASILCDELATAAHDEVSGAAAVCLKASILEQQSRLNEAIDAIRRGLLTLGVELPEDDAHVGREIGAGIGKMQAHLARMSIEDLAFLPALTDRREVATIDLLFQIIPAASQLNPPLFILAELILFDLALTYGTTAASSKNFVDCGIVFSVILHDYDRAYRMGKVAFTLLDRHAPTPLESSVNFVFGCFISHWGAHFQEGIDALARGHQRGVELGDVQHASYSIAHRALRLFFAGRDLAECQAQTERAAAYTLEVKAVGQHSATRILGRALAQLRAAEHADAALSDQAFIDEMQKTGNAHFLLVLGQTQMMVSVLLGDFAAAARWDSFATTHIGAGNGTFGVPDYHLLQSLILASKWTTAAAEERDKIVATLADSEAKLKTFADASPANFAHKYKLACAESARIRREPIDEVLRLYGEALAAAGDDFLHLRALINERQADFWNERRHPNLAKACLFEAYYLYRRWGAEAKLRLMEQAHPELAAGSAPDPSKAPFRSAGSGHNVEAGSLDLASVVKATHAISSEVKPERLFAVLMATIIENAGAQHGYLIVRADDGEELSVQARASITDSEPHTEQPSPLLSCDGVSLDVVRYVARTHETVVLDDAGQDAMYRADPHVKKYDVKSVLCMPVLNQGKLLAILYAENNAVTHAFTPERLGLLNVIAGQAAISIANAHLYNSLERKVAQRTRELTERNREVAALLNSMEQGVFTIDQKLLVQPPYSAYLEELLGTDDIAGRDCIELLFRGASVGSEATKTVRSALQFSFGVPAALAEANLSHLVHEFTRAGEGGEELIHFEIEWSLIVDHEEIVRKILVTLRDVTMLKQLRAEAEGNARELDIVGQILDSGVEHFQRFCASARTFMTENKLVLASEPALARASIERLFRNMHTVKGNARMLGLTHIASIVHLAEEAFEKLRRGAAPSKEMLAAAVDSVLDALRDYERVCERKLGDVLRGRDTASERAFGEIAAQLGHAKSGSMEAAAALSGVERALVRATAVPLREVVRNSSKRLPVMAQELGKVAPLVEAGSTRVLLTAPWASVMGDALMHAFQNSIDHGIESAEERESKGKPAQGKITVRTEETSQGIAIRLADDGRGLSVDALRAKSDDRDSSDEAAATLAFAAGISTAAHVTSASGRGVGLDAVRTFVRSQGGDVVIRFTGDMWEGYRPFELVFELPRDAVVTGASEADVPLQVA